MAFNSLADVPGGMRNQYDNLRNQWESLTGFSVTVSDWMLVEMANSDSYGNIGHRITSTYDFGQYMLGHVAEKPDGAYIISADQQKHIPWAFYGMDADSYQSHVTSYATEYKKITGLDIPPEALDVALKSIKDSAGGLLTGSQYGQKLMNDTNIQKTYGWVRYGMDYQQFQQQKQGMTQQFGRELTDQEATTQLQYLHQAQGMQTAVHAPTAPAQGQQPKVEAGISGSIAR